MKVVTALVALTALGAASAAWADEDEDLAIQLANPVAALISVPFQGNYNGGIGPAEDGDMVVVNVQPVVPFTLNSEWNLISRTIVPVTWQDGIFPDAGTQFGLGDTVQSLFFSPNRVVNGFTWGAGPVMMLPTATDEFLGRDTWAAGPTAVGLWQGNGWTVGMLANQLWSFAGDEDGQVNAAFFQPFITYTTADAWTFALNTESTYNWDTKEWSVPVNGTVSKLTVIGGQPVSIFGGVRYWADSPKNIGPTGFGARAGFTLLFPRR